MCIYVWVSVYPEKIKLSSDIQAGAVKSAYNKTYKAKELFFIPFSWACQFYSILQYFLEWFLAKFLCQVSL